MRAIDNVGYSFRPVTLAVIGISAVTISLKLLVPISITNTALNTSSDTILFIVVSFSLESGLL